MTPSDAAAPPSSPPPALPWWKEPTRGQWISFGAAWFGWVMDAFDFTIFLLVMPAIAKEFGVTLTATAGSITLTLLVRLLGGVAAGAAADRWGRKLPLMLSVIWFALCDGAVAFAPSFTMILVLRTLFGFGMGAEWTAGATLAMENWPQRSRGIASGILQGSWAIGYLLAAVVSGFVLPIWGWRGLFLVAAAPALLALPIRAWVPESQEFKRKDKDKEKKAGGPGLLVELRSVWKNLFWACVLMALGFAVYYGLTGLYPALLEKELGLDAAQRATYVSLFNIAMLGGAVVCGWLATRAGPRVAIGAPAALMILCLPLYLGTQPGVLWLGALMGGAFGAGFCGVTPVLLTSLFPAQVRARSVGFAYHAGAFAAAFVPMGTAALSDYAHLSLGWSIGLVSGISLLALIGALFVPLRLDEPVAAAPAAGDTVPAHAA
jgi:SHS family lactate transporter-like MFS transporter